MAEAPTLEHYTAQIKGPLADAITVLRREVGALESFARWKPDLGVRQILDLCSKSFTVNFERTSGILRNTVAGPNLTEAELVRVTVDEFSNFVTALKSIIRSAARFTGRGPPPIKLINDVLAAIDQRLAQDALVAKSGLHNLGRASTDPDDKLLPPVPPPKPYAPPPNVGFQAGRRGGGRVITGQGVILETRPFGPTGYGNPGAPTPPAGLNGPAGPSEPESSAALPEVDAVPAQIKAATEFSADPEGRIDVVRDPPGPAADSIQREFYDETRRKAITLRQAGDNQLGDLLEPVDRFAAALPENIQDASINTLWSRGNTLRRRLKAHQAAVASADAFDPARLTAVAAELLGDLIDTYNIFIAGDARGRELDQARLGPQEREAADLSVAAIANLVSAIRGSKGLATERAVDAVAEQIEVAKGAPETIDGDQAVSHAQKTANNFVFEILRRAYAPVRKLLALGQTEAGWAWKEFRAGTYRWAGPAAVFTYRPEITTFVADNAAAFKLFVEQSLHNPTLIRIIDIISEAIIASAM